MTDTDSPIALALKLEEYQVTTIECLVIDMCESAGFITAQDKETQSFRLKWVLKVTEHCQFIMALEEAIEQEEPLKITSNNIDKLIDLKMEKVTGIVEQISKEILSGIPPYKG